MDDNQKLEPFTGREKDELRKMFGSAGLNMAETLEQGLPDVVKAAKRYLQGFATLDSLTGVQSTLASVGFSDSIVSVQHTAYAPNVDPNQMKKEEAALQALLEILQEQITESNKRISAMIDQCLVMAEWCREQARKAADAMDHIVERMAKNSDLIHEADEMMESYQATGHFDREKARRRLLERGIHTSADIDDTKLIQLTEQARHESLQDNKDLSEKHAAHEKQRAAWETQEKELREDAQAIKEKQTAVNDGNLTPEEQARQLNELEHQYSARMADMTALHEQFKNVQSQLDAQGKALVDESPKRPLSKDSANSFSKGFSLLDAEDNALSGQFALAAGPEPQTNSPSAITLDNSGPADNKVEKPSGPGNYS